MLIPEVAVEYASLVDQAEGRVHAQVTVARETSDADREAIARQPHGEAGQDGRRRT